MLGSLLAALALVAAVIAVVAWRIGPAGVDSRALKEAGEERPDASDDDRRGRGRSGRD